MVFFGVIALANLVAIAMRTAGSITVSRTGDNAMVFEGIGRIGRTRRFPWSNVYSVTKEITGGRSATRWIVLHFRAGSRRSLKFGDNLHHGRRDFLIAALRKQVMRNGK